MQDHQATDNLPLSEGMMAGLPNHHKFRAGSPGPVAPHVVHPLYTIWMVRVRASYSPVVDSTTAAATHLTFSDKVTYKHNHDHRLLKVSD